LARTALDRGIAETKPFCLLLGEIRREGRMPLVQTATQCLFAYKVMRRVSGLPELIDAPLEDGTLWCEMCLKRAKSKCRHTDDEGWVLYCTIECCHKHCGFLP
jgi:hypothetical protein